MSKNNKIPVQIFQNASNTDTYTALYSSILRHENYKLLPCGLKMLYILCLAQISDKQAKRCLYNHINEMKKHGIDKEYPKHTSFVFPAKHAELYGIKRTNLSRDLNKLIKMGFVRKIGSNQKQFKVNVYCLDIMYKTKTKEEIMECLKNNKNEEQTETEK